MTTQFFSDLFTAAATANISTHTSDSGHAWILAKGTPEPKVFVSGVVSDGGAAIIEYLARLSTGEEKTVTASPANFTGLSADIARTAQVAARNSKGLGEFSAASLPATPTAPVVPPPDPDPDPDPPQPGTFVQVRMIPLTRFLR